MSFLKTAWAGFTKRNTEIGRFMRKFPPARDFRKFALQFNTLEEVWQACKRPDWMLWMMDNFEFRPADGLRLFACYSARRFSSGMDPRCLKVIEEAERFARREADSAEVNEARREACQVLEEAKAKSDEFGETLAWAAVCTAKEDPFTAANDTYVYTMKLAELQRKDVKLLRELQAARLRDLIGNPFKVEQDDEVTRSVKKSGAGSY